MKANMRTFGFIFGIFALAACGGTQPSAERGAIGAACANDNDCAAGSFCEVDDPDGQCVKACATQSDCPAGSVCTDENKCYKACSSAADCTRTGYTCVDSMPAKTCDVAGG